MEDWREGEPHEPRPLRMAKPSRRALLDAEDWRMLAKLGAQVGLVTFAVLWTALVLGLSVGMAKLSFCALAGCR